MHTRYLKHWVLHYNHAFFWWQASKLDIKNKSWKLLTNNRASVKTKQASKNSLIRRLFPTVEYPISWPGIKTCLDTDNKQPLSRENHLWAINLCHGRFLMNNGFQISATNQNIKLLFQSGYPILTCWNDSFISNMEIDMKILNMAHICIFYYH